MSAQHEIADSNGALVAWSGLVAGQALVNFGGDLFGDVPEDRIYRYSNAALALLQFGVILAVVLVIAKRGGPREALALGSPTSWKRAAAIGAFLVVGLMALFAVLGPLLQAGDAQKLAPEWDPNRVVPFAINATVIALVSPVVEELTYRGLGFTVLRRFGPAYAIVVTGTMFALGHALVALLPTAAAFGLGLAYLRSRTGSIHPGIILHVLFNTIGVLAVVLAS